MSDDEIQEMLNEGAPYLPSRTDLIQRLAEGPGSRELSDEVLLALGWKCDQVFDRPFIDPKGRNVGSFSSIPSPTESVDDALAMLPKTAIQKRLVSHVSPHENTGGEAWSFQFTDTTRTMGERAAIEQIKRLNITINGEIRETLEKAIAEHFLEFYSYGCPSHACAICIAVLKSV